MSEKKNIESAYSEAKKLQDMIERLEGFLWELRACLFEIRDGLPITKNTCVDNITGTLKNCKLEVLKDWGPDTILDSEARYPGIEPKNDLVIMPGSNGDWYVAVVPNGQGCIGKAIRLETSGGASTKCPGLTTAIADAYRAMKKARY